MEGPTFMSAERISIRGGSFTWYTNGGDEEREAMHQLYSHISMGAFHDSVERSREVDHQLVMDVVSRLTPAFEDPSYAVVEGVLRDIFTWLRDPPNTRFPSMWVNGSDRCQTALIAQVVAEVMPSASFFFTQPTETPQSAASSVIPSIAFQLAWNIPQVRSHIAQAIIHDPTIFDPALRVQAQMRKLIIGPLLKASESNMPPHSILILIHALEDCNEQDDFQESFLNACTQALESLKDKLPLKLLLLGRHTRRLSDCVAKLAGRSMVLQRPVDSEHWLRVEEENYWKEITLQKWKERVEKEEGSSERLHMKDHKITGRERWIVQRERQLELLEEEFKKKELELDLRERRLKEREIMSMKDDDTSSVGSGKWRASTLTSDKYPPKTSSPIPINRKQVVPGSVPSDSYHGSRSGKQETSDSRPSTAPSLVSTRSLNFDKFTSTNYRTPNPHSPHSIRSATMLPSDNYASTQPRHTSDRKPTDRYSTIPTPSSATSTRPWATSVLTSSASESSSRFFPGDGGSSFTSSPSAIEPDPGILQKINSYGISTSPMHETLHDHKCSWKTDENGVMVAGTLDDLVQFLVMTIDSPKHKDYRDIFAMACAEVTTPDQLFEIIVRRFQDAKDETSADVRVGQHNAYLVIEHWLELGSIPLDRNLRLEIQALCENAIQTNSEAARLYGIKNLRQLINQIVGYSASPSRIVQEGIPIAYLDPHGLAIALSRLEGENYRVLRPSDYVLHLAKRSSEKINKFYESNEKIKLWVIESILQYDDDVHRRAEVMTYFIKTALECRDMRNFSSATAIINALYSTAIQRLKVTMKTLTRDKQGKLSALYHIVNPDSNYRGYWDTLNKSASTADKRGACIPWLRVHLIEMEKALHEHPMIIEEGGQELINLKRYTTFMARSNDYLHYRLPTVGDHPQEEQLTYLLAQLCGVTYSEDTYERLLAVSATLEGEEVSNRRSRKDQMKQLGFKP